MDSSPGVDPFTQGFGFAVGFVSKGKASPKLPTSEALPLDKTKAIITLEQVITG